MVQWSTDSQRSFTSTQTVPTAAGENSGCTAPFNQTRLTYLINEHKLRAERQELRWDQVVLRMHFRGGYNQPLFLNLLWAIMVDVACVAILLWIASGLVMWWRLSRTRLWGACALGAGVLSFVFLMWRL